MDVLVSERQRPIKFEPSVLGYHLTFGFLADIKGKMLQATSSHNLFRGQRITFSGRYVRLFNGLYPTGTCFELNSPGIVRKT